MQVEAALRTSEQWRDVFENNPTMCFMLDAQDIVKAVNLFGVEQLGYTVRELVGQPMLGVFLNLIRRRFQRIHPDDQAMITDKIEIARRERGSSSWITESFIPATRSETSSWGAFPFSAHPVNLVEFVGK
jgi:PAS domain S-box-containing protein